MPEESAWLTVVSASLGGRHLNYLNFWTSAACMKIEKFNEPNPMTQRYSAD